MEVTTREWISFFQEARIPRTAAAQYAMTFVENRITMDMLLDLNKEYLKDMGITLLGDIIAILKHAKQAQSKLTTDRALNQSQKQVEQNKNDISVSATSLPKTQAILDSKKPAQREPRAVMIEKVEKSTCVEISKNKESVTRPASSVAKRLGPPATKLFDKIHPQEQKVIKKDIFSRLGKEVPLETRNERVETEKVTIVPQEKRIATSSTGILRQRLGPSNKTIGSSNSSNIIRLKPSASESSLSVKKPSEKTHDKRVSFGDKQNLRIEESQAVDTSKRKKYVMVTTKKDGTKVKEYLDPDDPRISEIGITRKLKPSSLLVGDTLQKSGVQESLGNNSANEPYKNMRITLSSSVHLQRNKSEIEDNNSSTDNKISKDLRQRITAPDAIDDRQPISRSKFSSRIQSATSLTRVTGNVKDRLSSRLGNSSSHVKPQISRIVPPDDTDREIQSLHKPIARKRMSGPYEDYSINEDQSLGLSPRRKRLHLEENKAGMGKGRLAGRLGSVSRVSF